MSLPTSQDSRSTDGSRADLQDDEMRFREGGKDAEIVASPKAEIKIKQENTV